MMKRLTTALVGIAVLAGMAGPVGAELQISEARASKVYYLPGEEASLTVTVTNPEAAEAAATLRVELITDVDRRQTLGEQALKVAGQGQASWTGKAKLEAVLGMELRATLLREGKAIASKSDYFACARNVHQVLMWGSGNHGPWQFSGQMDLIGDKYPAEFAGQWRATYGNFIEKFAWGPSDFDDLTPEQDRWWAGQSAYNECKPNMIAIIRALHEQGARVVTYGKAAAGGTVGYELWRRHPDQAAYSNGRFWGSYDAAYLDFYTALGPPHFKEPRPVPGTPEEMEKDGYTGAAWFKPFVEGGQNWSDLWYDCADPKAAAAGIGELAGCAKMFGFDGVRFDGEFWAGRYQRLDGTWNVPEGTEMEPANVALVQEMKRVCRQADPHYLFGYNAGTDIAWSVGKDNTPASFREKCQEDGLIANEGYAFPGDVAWREYLQRVRREAEIVRYYGGHYATYPLDRSGNKLYNCIGQYAMRAHFMGWYNGPGREWVVRAATRFSPVLFEDSLTTWREAAAKLQVSGSREMWWQEFAAVGKAPGGGTRYVIHVLNPPESPTTYGKEQIPKEPATGVTVKWPGLSGLKAAWVIDMPNATAEAVSPQGGAFSLGEVAYWKILVVDTDHALPAPTYEEPPAGAATGPSAQDLQIAAPTPQNKEAWSVLVEPERWGGGEGTADREADPQATGSGAVVGKPGRPTGSMAYTYEYPRIPGRYRATFRLKVADNTADQPVFQLSTGYSVESPFPRVGGLYRESKVLKGTDFAKASVYQTFATEFDYADYGYVAVGANYLGNVQGSWDNLFIELIRPWTDAELGQHYAKFTRPEGLAKAPDGVADVLVVRGLFNREYRIEEALAAVGTVKRSDAYTSYHQQQGTRLKGFDYSWQPLWQQDVIILADIETKGLNYGQVLMLTEWVKEGGALVILGGPVTLGQDDNMKRAWPLLLPVQLGGPWEIRKCEPPVRISAWKSPAAVMYRHMVTPKPGATVLLKGSKGEPLTVGAACGRGRVVVFTGTVLGEAPKELKAFWTTPEWPQSLANAIRWAAQAPR